MIRAAALLGLALLAARAGAVELDRGELRVELGGSARTLYTRTRSLHLHTLERYSAKRSDTGALLGRLRLEAEAAYGENWSGELVYDHEGRSGTLLDDFSFALAEEIGTRTWFDLDHTISDHDDLHWRHLLYRGWVRYHDPRFELTLGRQRIPLGRARLWNPTDLFNPIEPLAIEGEQRIGQDAAVARLRLAPGLFAMGISSPQDDPDEHRSALRLELARPELDAALMAARIGRDWVVGGDFARNLAGAAIRGEATYTWLEDVEQVWQIVLSIDGNVPLGSGVYLGAEHFYNENVIDPSPEDLIALAEAFGAPPAQLTPAQTGQLLGTLASTQLASLDRFTTVARHQTGLQAGYDLTPLLRANLLAICDWNGPSVAVFPVLSWSVRDDLELSGGLQLFYGSEDRDDPSQYGGTPNLFFVQIDFFF